MKVYGLIVGGLSFLTPLVFPFIFVLGIVAQMVAINTKLYWRNNCNFS